jgi:exopolysaccharide production protein ExoZ
LVAIPLDRGGYTLHVAEQPLVAWSRYANLAINPIVWDFVAGMAAGWLYGSRFRIGSVAMIYAAVAILLVLLWMAWLPLGMMNFFGPQGWGAPLTVLFVGIVLLAKADAIKVPKYSVWMGGISYSLYLVHVYVFEVLQRIATTIPLDRPASEIALFLTRPVVAVICAWAIFRYVESPLSAWVRGRLSGLRVPWGIQAESATFEPSNR